MQTIGIDLGSNTLRAVLLGDEGEHIWEYECVVRTAQGLSQQPFINNETFKRLSVAIEEIKQNFYQKIGRNLLDFPYLAVATAALRKAENKHLILDMLKQQHGILFEIIDARAEALLTLNASLFRLKQDSQLKPVPFFLVDIGGASTEVSFYHSCQYQYLDPFKNNEVDFFQTHSFDIGIVTLKESASHSFEIKGRIDHLIQEVQKWKKACLNSIDCEPLFLISGGVSHTVAALKNKQSIASLKAGLYPITLSDVWMQKEYYAHWTKKQKIAFAGEKRYDLIEVGMLLYESFFTSLGINESLSVSESLREGAALYAKSLF